MDAGPFSPLVQWLQSVGFAVQAEMTDPRYFGNSLLTLGRRGTRIRAVRDRSQWFVELAARGSDVWFPPFIWAAALDDALPSHAPSNDEEVAIIRDRLDDIDSLTADSSGTTLETLNHWQAQWASFRRAQLSNER